MIGLYIPKDTSIHRLNPRVKLLFLTVCGTFIIMVSSIPLLGLFLLFVALFYRVAKVPFSTVINQFKSMGLLLVLLFVFQAIFNSWLTGVEVVLRLIILFFYHHLFHSQQKFQIWWRQLKQGFSLFVMLV